MRLFKFACPMALYLLAGAETAKSNEETDLISVYGSDDIITLATGAPQALYRAPATATVITAKEIKDIGATDLDQVLETVPGLHVATTTPFYNPAYIIRGIYSSVVNPQVLVLINGIPITNLYQGDRNLAWGGMPVHDIARIEVIRSPGSALYGADAFAGTINIITKAADDINGNEIGIGGGSFNSKEAWVLHGSRWKGTEIAFSLELYSANDKDDTITSDAQTGLDALFGTKASLAPAPVNLRREGLDSRIDISNGNWRLRFGYQGRRHLGVGVGVAQALDPNGSLESDRINSDLTYHAPHFKENWDLTTQLSYFSTTQISQFTIFPPGAFGGTFPGGMIGNPNVYERHELLSITGLYTGFLGHRIRLGTGFNQGSLYKATETKNYDPSFAPLGSIEDVTNTAPFIRPHVRDVLYFLAQDEWSYMRDWELTTGIRWDHYSDFGNTLNPRLDLVWLTRYDLTTKLLYGRAFRAPSFAELYAINNPVLQGNPNLKPETIDTLELLFDYRPTNELRTNLSFYKYETKGNIRYIADPAPATTITARNTGNQRGYGFEFEISWRVSTNNRFTGNYAYQQSTDEATNTDAGNAPHHHVYGRSDWAFMPLWNLDTQVNWIADRNRVYGDSRPKIGDYTTVDLTLRRTKIRDNFEISASVYNLFNADVREPSPSPGLIANDLPLSGRSFFLELSYRNK